MPLKPKKGETRQEFISRSISELVHSGYPQLQAVAIAHQYWRDRNKK